MVKCVVGSVVSLEVILYVVLLKAFIASERCLCMNKTDYLLLMETCTHSGGYTRKGCTASGAAAAAEPARLYDPWQHLPAASVPL